jgi:hypothetical protein
MVPETTVRIYYTMYKEFQSVDTQNNSEFSESQKIHASR